MYNKTVLVDSLREISTLESNRFKSLAYLNACRVLESMSDEEFNERKSFLNIPGIGQSINTKIIDFKKDGTIPAKLLKLREENKSYLDPKYYKVRKGFITKRIPYAKAEIIVNEVVNEITSKAIEIFKDEIHVLGSFRRHKSLIADLDILLESEDAYRAAIGALKWLVNEGKLSIVVEGPMKTTFVFNNIEKTTIDVSWCNKTELPYSILHFTGSTASNIRLRSVAQCLGYKLNQYGLFDSNGKRVVGDNIVPEIKTEKDIFAILGLKYVEPENR